MFLIDDLLLAPVNGFKFILRQVQQLADKELNDESLIKEQLLELQMRLELEEISEEDYAEAEREQEFDAIVKDVASRYEGKLSFKYTGPWPPYNFVHIRLKLERGEGAA